MDLTDVYLARVPNIAQREKNCVYYRVICINPPPKIDGLKGERIISIVENYLKDTLVFFLMNVLNH